MISKPKLLVFGAGGHAKVLLDAFFASQPQPQWDIVILTPEAHLHGSKLLGVPIIGDDDCIDSQIQVGATHFVVGIGSVKSNTLRTRLYVFGLKHQLTPLAVIHPNAICSKWAQLGAGAQVMAGAIINADAIIGDNVIINTGAIVEHDCHIGEHVHIAPGARLSGGVVVEAGAHIGSGACIRQGIQIGKQAVIGMGAVVVRDVLPNTVVMGVPAKQKK